MVYEGSIPVFFATEKQPRITVRWIILGLIACARNVRFITEQPASSVMLACGYFRYMALIIRPLKWIVANLQGNPDVDPSEVQLQSDSNTNIPLLVHTKVIATE